MVIWHNQLLSTSGGAIFLMEASLHTASALPSGGDFSSPATAAVLICPLWWSISLALSTHTATTVQSSRSLTYQPLARVQPPLTTILVGNTGRSSTSSTLSEEEVVALSSDWL